VFVQRTFVGVDAWSSRVAVPESKQLIEDPHSVAVVVVS
jgi:hypothetical protein